MSSLEEGEKENLEMLFGAFQRKSPFLIQTDTVWSLLSNSERYFDKRVFHLILPDFTLLLFL